MRAPAPRIEDPMFSSAGRWPTTVAFALFVVVCFTGCSRVGPVGDDLLRMGAAVVRDVGEVHPDPGLPRLALKTSLQKYLASQQWAAAKAGIGNTVKISRTDPICGTTIDTVLDGKPETTESLFAKLADNTASMNSAYSMHADATTLSKYFTTSDPSEKDKAAFAVTVAAFKDAYCK